jgi:hypothetical protein
MENRIPNKRLERYSPAPLFSNMPDYCYWLSHQEDKGKEEKSQDKEKEY